MATKNRPTAIVFAYACHPTKGSEAGAGWAMVQAIAEHAAPVVLVAPWYIQAINKSELAQNPGIRFVSVPAPPYSRLGQRHRLLWFLVYIGWMRQAIRKARELHADSAFDFAFHATPAVYWLPTPARQLGIPVIWGPVGGATTTPRQLWRVLGIRGLMDEFLDRIAVNVAATLPTTRRTWRDVTIRIVQNRETREKLMGSNDNPIITLNHVQLVNIPRCTVANRTHRILWASPMESRKGPRLAIHALAQTSENVHLDMVGDGPERPAVSRLAQKLGVSHRVTMHGWVSRQIVTEMMAKSAATLFTGLREEGGLALGEAMLCGSPVIVLANGGARTIAEATTDATRTVLIQPSDVLTTARHMGEAMTRFAGHPSQNHSPTLDVDAARSALGQLIGRF